VRWVPSAAIALVLLGACETVIVDVDPQVDYGDEPAYVPVGEPSLELGYYVEQLYQPLRDGDGCPIIYGFQGGTWTMPAVRIQGINSVAMLDCDLVTGSGEVLGAVVSRERFYLAPDGWVEIQAHPVPAAHAPPNETNSIGDLYGMNATLRCRATDSEARTAERTIMCVLEEG